MTHKAAQTVLWNRTVRTLHWLVAGGVFLNLFVLEEGDPPHRWVGTFVAAMVVVRSIYGFFIATDAAKFSNWPLKARDLIHFVETHASKQPADYSGHNPAASLTYIAVWLLIFGLVITGWMMSLDAFWGEEWLEDLHGLIADGLMVLVVIHLAGIAVDSFLFRRHTWLGMFTGKR